jgi:hypothetical protein
MWVVIFHLACLAVTLELIYRAPEYDEHGEALRRPRRLKRAAAPMPPMTMAQGPVEAGPEAP